jgi:hypothetical protein
MTQIKKNRKFTYGDQFDEDKTPLIALLELCVACAPSRVNFQEELRARYFEGHGRDPAKRDQNSKTMAMNCLLSLNAYGFIQLSERGTSYLVTSLAKDLLTLKESERDVFRRFAIHILTNLEGLLLARLIERIRARGEQVTLEYLGEEMNDLGIKTPPSSTYISTMRSWLAKAGVFRESGYEVNWDVIYNLLNIDAEFIDKLYQLNPEQKYFLLSLATLDVRTLTPSNKVANHTRSVYKIRLTTKNLVKDVLEPLEALGLIETQKTTSGRGAKPHLVCLTAKGQNEILEPLINNLASLTELTSSDLNRPFEDVVADLDVPDKYIRGVALELFAIWIIRLLGLRFSNWRLRHFQSTGGGEVDVMAASDKIVYSRWQIQCKNNTKTDIDVDVIAKEIGLTFTTHADIVMVVTTTRFTSSAVNFANQVTNNSRYYVILLEGEDVKRIVEDRTCIIDILNVKARRAFARRELGFTEFDEALEEIEELETEEELEQAIEDAAIQMSLFEDEAEE